MIPNLYLKEKSPVSSVGKVGDVLHKRNGLKMREKWTLEKIFQEDFISVELDVWWPFPGKVFNQMDLLKIVKLSVYVLLIKNAVS